MIPHTVSKDAQHARRVCRARRSGPSAAPIGAKRPIAARGTWTGRDSAHPCTSFFGPATIGFLSGQIGWSDMGRASLLWAILLLLPVAAAQPTEPGIYNPTASTPTTMYFHINGFQDFPVNTQMPDDRYAETVDRGLVENSGCIETEGQTFTSRSGHTWYGYSSPSIVEYDVDNDGEPRIHQERGISYDVELDGSVVPMFSWYLEASWPEQDLMPADPPAAPPVPEVVVRATLREGDDISVGHSALNVGKIVAIGETAPTLLAGDATQETDHVKVHKIGDRFIYEFTFPLAFDDGSPVIPKDESFNIRVDAFVKNDVCEGPGSQDDSDYLMLDHVLVHSSSAYRPLLKWAVMNPLYIEALHPQFVGDDLAFHTASNSVWGSYDVHGDLESEQPGMDLQINGPTEARSLQKVALQDHTRDHYKHNLAVTAVWLWDYRTDEAEPGLYEVFLKIRNDQDNAEAWAMATFQIGSGGAEVCAKNIGDEELVCQKPESMSKGEESPGIGPVLLLGLLAAFVARRR